MTHFCKYADSSNAYQKPVGSNRSWIITLLFNRIGEGWIFARNLPEILFPGRRKSTWWYQVFTREGDLYTQVVYLSCLLRSNISYELLENSKGLKGNIGKRDRKATFKTEFYGFQSFSKPHQRDLILH